MRICSPEMVGYFQDQSHKELEIYLNNWKESWCYCSFRYFVGFQCQPTWLLHRDLQTHTWKNSVHLRTLKLTILSDTTKHSYSELDILTSKRFGRAYSPSKHAWVWCGPVDITASDWARSNAIVQSRMQIAHDREDSIYWGIRGNRCTRITSSSWMGMKQVGAFINSPAIVSTLRNQIYFFIRVLQII